MARENVAVSDGGMLMAPPREVEKSAQGMMRCPSVRAYTTRCFMFLASLAGTTTATDVGSSAVEPFVLEGTPLKWVKALPQEGHASACLRHGLDPTGALVFLPDEASVECLVFFSSVYTNFNPDVDLNSRWGHHDIVNIIPCLHQVGPVYNRCCCVPAYRMPPP